MPVVSAAAENHAEVRVSTATRGQTFGCLLSVWPSEAMLMSMSWAATEEHIGVHGQVDIHDQSCYQGLWCYHQRPWGSLWLVLPPEVMLMSMTHATARNHVEVYDPCCR